MNVYPLKCHISAAAGVTRVDVYDDIGAGGLFSEGLTAKGFAGQLAGVKGPLEVHINSGGGDVFDGIAIGNAIRAHKGPVTTVVDGLAASIASVIAQAGADRVVQPGSMMMIHDAYGMCVGDAAEMAKMASTLDEVSGNLAGIYASRAGGDAEGWREAMRAESWYTAQAAVDAGLADRVGDGGAELPAGLDVAAFTGIPSQIAAALRSLPKAATVSPAVKASQAGVVLTAEHIEAIAAGVAELLAAWDGNAAMTRASNADNPAAAFKSICAGRRAGDPSQRKTWALPHHDSPGGPANPDGVSAALGRLDSTQGLINKDAAEAHLKAHQGSSSNHADQMPAWLSTALTAKEAANR